MSSEKTEGLALLYFFVIVVFTLVSLNRAYFCEERKHVFFIHFQCKKKVHISSQITPNPFMYVR